MVGFDFFYIAFLTGMELTFIFVFLLILHGLKHLIGSSALYMTLGILLAFMHFAGACMLRLVPDVRGMEIAIADSVMTIPFLGILLILYAVDGTLAAQRVIIAAFAAYGFSAYLSWITQLQCEWPTSALSQGIFADTFAQLLGASGKRMAAGTVTMAIDLFTIPVLFQKLKNNNCHIVLSAIASILLGALLDRIIFTGVLCWGDPQKLILIGHEYLPRALMGLWIGILSAVYLMRIGKEVPGESRRTLDIFFAFFGSYGRAKLLEQNLVESEQKYRTIIQNASDLILVTDISGMVVDANRAVLDTFGLKNISDVVGSSFAGFLETEKCEKISLPDNDQVLRVILPGNQKELEFAVSRVRVDSTPAVVMIGRDITEREKLAKEREILQNENAHRQRLEAIGRLAGGIAHDFNNHLHAIHGHLDLIYMGDDVSEDCMRHLEKIDSIAEQAGKLTSQLLGYARKGRRQIEKISLRSLVESARGLFIPETGTGMQQIYEYEKRDLFLEGDKTQLQQAILNLMINASDAMDHLPVEKRILKVRSGSPEWLGITLVPPPDMAEQKLSCCCAVRVEDCGNGIAPEIIERIFEPFFTTKPTGKGTGMGLPMSYGAAREHNGWIQYDKASSGGAAFTIVLPACAPSDKEKYHESP